LLKESDMRAAFVDPPTGGDSPEHVRGVKALPGWAVRVAGERREPRRDAPEIVGEASRSMPSKKRPSHHHF
jgi:hypothetical protein